MKKRIPEVQNSELDPRLLGTAANNALVGHCSTPRAVMDSNHMASRPSLINPDKKESLISGVEYELGKYIEDIKVPENCEVVGTVQKIPNHPANPETTVFVTYERNGSLWLDLIVVPRFKSKHSYFGYRLHQTEEMKSLSFGKSLKKDSILASTDSLLDDGTYGYGFNANVVMISDPATAEDGFVVRRGFLEKMAFTTVETKIINLDKDSFMLNYYGDEDNYKMFPNIGERVKENGILGVIRKRNDFFAITDLNDDDIKEVDYTFDDPIYLTKGARESTVVDIKVVRGSNIKCVYSDNMVTQLEENYELNCNYAESIIKQYFNILRELRRKFGGNFTPRLGKDLNIFVRDQMALKETKTTKCKTSNKRKDIDQYRIEITVMSIVVPNLGFKLTDLHGGKGVICAIREDEDMPFYPGTNIRADIIAGGASETISRMNTGRVYEAYMGAANRDNRNVLLNNLIGKYGSNFINKINSNDCLEIKEFLKGYYELINPDMVDFLMGLNESDLEEHIYEVLTEWLYIYFPPNNKYNVVDVIDCIESSPYKPIESPIQYKVNGVVKTTVENVLIGRMYYLLLDRTARDFSAVSSAKVNNFMLPIKGSEADRSKYPHNLTPVTNLSETETRIIAALAPPVLIAELYDITLNPTSQKQLIRHILESGKMFDPNFSIDRKVNPYGGSKPLELMKHIFRASGIEMLYLDDDTVPSDMEMNGDKGD